MNKLQIIENDLVPVYETGEGIKVVNGRELHQALQSKQDFSTWVKRRLLECDAEEKEDFDRLHKKMEANNATMIEYLIKLDTAKEMAMLERNEKGKQVRKYFIEVERKYKEKSIDRSQLSPEIQALYGFLDLWLLKRELFLCKKTLDLWVAISYIITKRQGGDKDVAQNRQTYRWGRAEKQANLIESNRDNCKEISRMCRNHSENSD